MLNNIQLGDTIPFFAMAKPSAVDNFTAEDNRRISQYLLFWNFYLGNHWKEERPDNEPQVTANFCESFVNKSTSFLMSKGWYIVDKNDEYSRQNIDYLDKIWKYNNKDLISYEIAQMGSICGDVYILVVPDQGGDLKILMIPPMFVSPKFHPANKDLLLSAIIQYPTRSVNDQTGINSFITMEIDSKKVVQYLDDKHISTYNHDLNEMPLIFIKNRPLSGSAFGVSDLKSIVSLNKLYNEKLTDISDIINYHAAPVTIAYGVKIKQLQRGARKMWMGLPPPDEARIENLQLDSDLAAADNHLKNIQQLIHQLGSIPEVALGKNVNISNTSGLAIQLLFQPIIDLNSVKQLTYGTGIKSVNRLLLKYGIKNGEISYPNNEKELKEFFCTEIGWRDPLPRDEMIRLNMLLNRLKNGAIKVSEFHSQLGDSNPAKTIEEIMEEIEHGYNIPIALSTGHLAQMLGVTTGTAPSDLDEGDEAGTKEVSNIGGIMRDGDTLSQVEDEDSSAEENGEME
jgi:hypothetical protein